MKHALLGLAVVYTSYIFMAYQPLLGYLMLMLIFIYFIFQAIILFHETI